MTAPVRPIAICIIRRNNELLVFEGRDETDDRTFYRPLGGEIEFGERSEDAVRRELREEIDAELTNVSLVTVLENLFTFEGRASHEIVFVYEARFADQAFDERDTFVVTEETGTLPGLWRGLDSFDEVAAPLYPEGLLELLRGP